MSDQRAWWLDRPDEDHRPPAARGRGSRRGFGQTWWGGAWVDALEHRAGLNTGRLARGRSYARRGAVIQLDIAPGVVLASVQGTRALPYTVTVRVRAFSDDEWERVLACLAAQLGRTAALLEGELPPEVVSDVATAGLELLPGSGDVQPRCSCPDVADPCKHSAAVCFLVADALDADPFELLRLRGRSRGDVLAALRARRTTGAGPVPAHEPEAADAGVVAREVYAQPDRSTVEEIDLGPLPEPPAPRLPPASPGRVRWLDLDPPATAAIDADDLRSLAADAAARAWQLATGDGDGGLSLDAEDDLARRAAALVGTPALSDVAHRAGIPARDLTGWALAWRRGGLAGLRALRETWTPDDETMREAVEALVGVADDRTVMETGTRPDTETGTTAGTGTNTRAATGTVTVAGNRATCGRRQLRLGPDLLWYPFVRSFGGWDLAGPGQPTPHEALANVP